MSYHLENTCDYLGAVAIVAAAYLDHSADFDGTVAWARARMSDPAMADLFNAVRSHPEEPGELARSLLPDDLLRQLPFGEQLVESMGVYEGQPDAQRVHVLYVLSAVDRFLRSDADDRALLKDTVDRDDMRAILEDVGRILDSNDQARRARALLPLMALYHDVGKSLGVENHPTNGYELLRADEQGLRLLLGVAEENSSLEDEFLMDLFLTYVRYHDLWGNIATGEAGLPLMSLVLDPTETNADTHRLRVLLMLVGNLSDAYGAYEKPKADGSHELPRRLDSLSIKRIRREWSLFNSTMEGDAQVSVARMWSDLVRLGQQPAEPIERLYLLIQKAGICGTRKSDVVRAFRALPARTEVTLRFATVRLAYALRFVTALGEAAKQRSSKPPYAHKALVDHLCDMVAELCAQYAAQIEYYAARNVVTVLELSALQPAAYPPAEGPRNGKQRFSKMLVDSVFEQARGIWLSRVLDLVSVRPGR